MKKCPFCKTEVDSDAKFCVYCMHSLVEKQTIACTPTKRPVWIFWLMGLGLVAIAIVLGVFLSPQTSPQKKAESPSITLEESTPLEEHLEENNGEDLTANESPAITPQGSESDSSDSNNQNTEHASPSQSNTQTTNPSQSNTQTTNPSQSNTQTTNPSQSNTQTTNPSQSNTQTTNPSQSNTQTTNPSQSNTQTTNPSQSDTETTTPPATEQVIYSYRLVNSGEEYNAGYVNAGNDIIITGVTTLSSNGEYNIPDYIDGKQVLVIASNAFTGSGAKKVVIPSTVTTIWGNAFAGCPLTDVYFCGKAIYAEGRAFTGISGNLTIHCSATCSDRNYRYYKNTAPNYGAVYAEWNG